MVFTVDEGGRLGVVFWRPGVDDTRYGALPLLCKEIILLLVWVFFCQVIGPRLCVRLDVWTLACVFNCVLASLLVCLCI